MRRKTTGTSTVRNHVLLPTDRKSEDVYQTLRACVCLLLLSLTLWCGVQGVVVVYQLWETVKERSWEQHLREKHKQEEKSERLMLFEGPKRTDRTP